jgi:NAD(P) transhydrogenase subunit alpha
MSPAIQKRRRGRWVRAVGMHDVRRSKLNLGGEYMAVIIGVPKESAEGEQRVALTPEVVKKFVGLGAAVQVQAGAGGSSHYGDEDYVAAGARIVDSDEAVHAQSDIVLRVGVPTEGQIESLKPGAVLVGFLQPYADRARVVRLAERRVTSLAVELVPRISRAQSMDALSSQAAVAGYQCVLIAASHCPKFFPMLTYAAGTIRPARVLVIGAGVAGLQAIATAKRLGAIVEAYDVRPETKEQIESLGAKFVDTGVSAAGSGGYARELTEDEKAQQAIKLGKAVANADVLITTAAIPGKRAPRIITHDMVQGMKAGAVVVDMACESGGNVDGTVAGQSVRVGNARVIGPTDITSRMPVHASDMYAKNLFNLLSPFVKDGQFVPDWEDDVMSGTALTHEGEVRHATVKQVLGL